MLRLAAATASPERSVDRRSEPDGKLHQRIDEILSRKTKDGLADKITDLAKA